MAFELNHWNDPRGSIANKYKDNDFAYVTRGASIALFVLQQFDIKPSDAKNMSILDYGCGTGRASYFLSKIFGNVVGYDPNQNCIREAYNENIKSDSPVKNVLYTSDIRSVTQCDLAFSSNVIEHLNFNDAQVMINNLKAKVKGHTLLWYSPVNNGILSDYIDKNIWESKLEAAKKGGRIQIDLFDFKQRN